MKPPIDIPMKKVADFYRRKQITELALFGFVLHEDFCPDRNVDVLARFYPKARHTLFDMVRMQEDLNRILGRQVDLVSRRGIEASRNYLRKNAILKSVQVVYAA